MLARCSLTIELYVNILTRPVESDEQCWLAAGPSVMDREHTLDDDPVDELTARLQQLTRAVEELEIENELLEDYVAQAEQQGLIVQCQQPGCKKSKSTRRKKDVEAKAETQLPSLTEDEKGDIVNQAVEGLQNAIEKTKVDGDKDVDDIRTLMEEVDVRIRETKQETYEFKRDIILGADDSRTGKTNAEKVIKFFERQIHDKEVMIEKLSLKNTTFKAAIAKLEAQLAHKEEMGEVLHLVDFEQLKIENQQYFERIDAKNKELLQLKLSTGKTVQLLNEVKGQLSSLMAEGSQLRASISSKHHELDGFESDFQKTATQSAQAATSFKKLQSQQKDAEQPQILEYIKLKAQVAELQKEAADWQRKLDVACTSTARSSSTGGRPPFGAGGGRSRNATSWLCS